MHPSTPSGDHGVLHWSSERLRISSGRRIRRRRAGRRRPSIRWRRRPISSRGLGRVRSRPVGRPRRRGGRWARGRWPSRALLRQPGTAGTSCSNLARRGRRGMHARRCMHDDRTPWSVYVDCSSVVLHRNTRRDTRRVNRQQGNVISARFGILDSWLVQRKRGWL